MEGGNRILIYGDSNVWGLFAWIFRYRRQHRWPARLQELLGSSWQVEAQGCNGRTAGDCEPPGSRRNGQAGYVAAVDAHSSPQYVVVALGTNDLKARYRRTTTQIMTDLLWYKQHTNARILYLGISRYRKNWFVSQAGADELRKALAASGETVISAEDLIFSADGIHYSKSDHDIIATRVFEKIKEIQHEI